MISLSRAKILTLIHYSKEPLTISNISEKIGLKRTTTYHHLEELKKRKLIIENKEEKQQGQPVFITTNKSNPLTKEMVNFAEKFLQINNLHFLIKDTKKQLKVKKVKFIESKKPKTELIIEGSLKETDKLEKEAKESGFDFSKVKHVNAFFDIKQGSKSIIDFANKFFQKSIKKIKIPENALVSFGSKLSPKGKDTIKVFYSHLEPVRIKVMRDFRNYPIEQQILMPKNRV